MTNRTIRQNLNATESINVHDLREAVDSAERVLHQGIARGLIEAGGAFEHFRAELSRLFGEQRERVTPLEPKTELPEERIEAIVAAKELRDRFEFIAAALQSGGDANWDQCARELESAVETFAIGLRELV